MTEQVYTFDDELVIATPEHVELYFVLASIGNRFIAAFIDHVIQVIAILAVSLVVYVSNLKFPDWEFNKWLAAASILFSFGIYVGYFALFETLWSGQTPGKRWLKLRVIRDDGRPIGFFEATVRNLIRILDMMPPAPLPSYAVGVMTIILSPQSKRVGDYIAGTVVVKERSTEAPPLKEIISLSEAEARYLRKTPEKTFSANLRQLSKEEVTAVEMFMRRRYDLSVDARAQLATRLASTLCNRLKIDPGLMSTEDLIEEIDRQYKVQSKYFD
ncbi:MAG TPA: RDD family protein [Blastocatellia bacterium]|nr:RDD family protein [Blastocatellia bacterium]